MLFFGLTACSHVLHVCILGYLCPCFSPRLKYLKHTLFNVYLATFLGSMDNFTRSIDSPASYHGVGLLRCVLTFRDIFA